MVFDHLSIHRSQIYTEAQSKHIHSHDQNDYSANSPKEGIKNTYISEFDQDNKDKMILAAAGQSIMHQMFDKFP